MKHIAQARSFAFMTALILALLAILAVPQAWTQQPPALIDGVDAIGITVSDMDRAVDFYSKVLTFEKVSDTEVAGENYRASRRCVRVAHARGANEAGRRVHRTHRVSRAERSSDPG